MKYYTAFLFKDNKGIEGLHMTHKYLGALKEDKLATIVGIIDFYLGTVNSTGVIAFQTRALFGPNEDVPVLTCSERDLRKFGPLRSALDYYAKDRYPYTPHVSLNNCPNWLHLTLQPMAYALMSKGTVLESWPITASK